MRGMGFRGIRSQSIGLLNGSCKRKLRGKQRRADSNSDERLGEMSKRKTATITLTCAHVGA